MSSVLTQEVLSAADKAVRPTATLVSRLSIEAEIEDHPGSYPTLAQRSRAVRRSSISRIMNRFYPPWSEGKGAHPYSFVWKVRDTPLIHPGPLTLREEGQ